MKRTGDYKFRPVVNFYNNSGARGERNEMAHRGGGKEVSVKFSSVIHLTVDNYYLRFGRRGR